MGGAPWDQEKQENLDIERTPTKGGWRSDPCRKWETQKEERKGRVEIEMLKRKRLGSLLGKRMLAISLSVKRWEAKKRGANPPEVEVQEKRKKERDLIARWGKGKGRRLGKTQIAA